MPASARMLTVNPVANLFGSTTITLSVTDTVGATTQSMTDTFVLTVNQTDLIFSDGFE